MLQACTRTYRQAHTHDHVLNIHKCNLSKCHHNVHRKTKWKEEGFRGILCRNRLHSCECILYNYRKPSPLMRNMSRWWSLTDRETSSEVQNKLTNLNWYFTTFPPPKTSPQIHNSVPTKPPISSSEPSQLSSPLLPTGSDVAELQRVVPHRAAANQHTDQTVSILNALTWMCDYMFLSLCSRHLCIDKIWLCCDWKVKQGWCSFIYGLGWQRAIETEAAIGREQ